MSDDSHEKQPATDSSGVAGLPGLGSVDTQAFTAEPTGQIDGGESSDARTANIQERQDDVEESSPPKQYSVFSTKEKRVIIATASLASFFSPLSSTIYFPALTTISEALNVSLSQINLTVTTYLILQGVAPMMIAGFSDRMGRRPAYILCFSIFFAANLGLGLQNSYAALLVLRCLQSAGSSGTIALGNGLVGDTVTSEQRGKYIAFASLGALLGPAIAPLIGGAISQSLDWHWIFWFLLIFTAVFCIPFLLLLPETCREVVGDGSIPPPPLNWSLTDAIRHRQREKQGLTFNVAEQLELRKNYRFRFPSPLPVLKILVDVESVLVLLGNALGVICFYAISTGASSSFKEQYKFSDIQVALMFIPIGVGGILSALTIGALVDWNYRRHARKHGITIIKGVRQDLSEFPIEVARLEVGLPLVLLGSAVVIGYGWTLDDRVSLAGPVILLFLLGYALIATSQVFNVLMTDIWPGNVASAAAANNFVRCELGAAATAAIEPMSAALGRGWAYTVLALIYIAYAPVLLIVMRRGIRLRRAKKDREARKQAHRAEKSGTEAVTP